MIPIWTWGQGKKTELKIILLKKLFAFFFKFQRSQCSTLPWLPWHVCLLPFHCQILSIRIDVKGLPWQTNGEDSVLPLQGTQVQTLVRDLRSHMLHDQKKKLEWMWNSSCLIGAYNTTLPRYFSFNKFLSFKVEICYCSVTQPCPTLCNPMDCSTPGLSVLHLLPQSVSSVPQSCPTLCNPMNHSTPGLPVHHQLLEFTQTHVHLVGDAIQPSHPLSSPSPPALNLSQY